MRRPVQSLTIYLAALPHRYFISLHQTMNRTEVLEMLTDLGIRNVRLRDVRMNGDLGFLIPAKLMTCVLKDQLEQLGCHVFLDHVDIAWRGDRYIYAPW